MSDGTSAAEMEQCQLPECDNNRILGAHYCSPEHEAKAAREGIRVTGPPSELWGVSEDE